MATDTTRDTETTPAGTDTAADTAADTGPQGAPQDGGSAATEATTGDTAAAAGTEATDKGTSTDDAATGDAPATTDAASRTGTDADTAGVTGSTDATDRGATPDTPATAAGSTGLFAGAGALVSAVLGLVSLTGTSLTDMLRDREQLLGQIEAATGMPGDQIASFYGAPWDTAALVNGVFAVLAVIIGAVLTAGPAAKAGAAAWARPVAFGGVLLGVLGLIVSGGMYFDLFAAAPVLPSMPMMPGMPG